MIDAPTLVPADTCPCPMYITDLTRFLDKSGAIGPMLYPWILTFVGVGVHLIDGAAARLVNDSFRRE